jgi:hypothetical protein
MSEYNVSLETKRQSCDAGFGEGQCLSATYCPSRRPSRRPPPQCSSPRRCSVRVFRLAGINTTPRSEVLPSSSGSSLYSSDSPRCCQVRSSQVRGIGCLDHPPPTLVVQRARATCRSWGSALAGATLAEPGPDASPSLSYRHGHEPRLYVHVRPAPHAKARASCLGSNKYGRQSRARLRQLERSVRKLSADTTRFSR